MRAASRRLDRACTVVREDAVACGYGAARESSAARGYAVARRHAFAAAALLAAALAGTSCSGPPPEPGAGDGISVAEAMGEVAAEGFARATEPRAFSFPEDHGPHPDFRTEWWYFTGNLSDAEGAEFGVQLTFFRQALAPEAPERGSDWAARDVWFAHFAAGEGGNGGRGEFEAHERFERGALGLAGATASPFSVRIGDWSAVAASPDSAFPIRLAAEVEGLAVNLVVEPRKPLVLQGDSGLSRKGAAPGNASYYYSATRLEAAGSIARDGVERAVSGTMWLDREWSTSALSEGQEGWDWFAIQLADGRDLMLYRLRRSDGTTDPFDSGVLVELDGSATRLGAGDVVYEPVRWWESGRSDVRYPVEWRLSVEPLDMELEVRPLLDDSEMDLSVRYWEGAVRVRGQDPTGALAGVGFLEMTGYGADG